MKKTFHLLLILFLVSCNDDDMTIVQLPPVTSEGMNTFGCLVNGEPWVAQVNNNVDDKLDVIFNPFTDELQVHANLITSTRNEFIVFATNNVTSVGDYNLVNIGDIFIDFEDSKAYELDTTKIRKLTLEKFDMTNKIVSGTFEFTVFRGEDTLKITEGRFDAKYRN